VVAQVLLGVLLGGLGIMLATPLAAAGMVVVERLYLEDVLGEQAPD
jgi:predicted PurR-regulated permease PerM